MKKAVTVIVLLALAAGAFVAVDARWKPSLQLVGISSDSIVAMRDTLRLSLRFEDSFGDVGDSVKGLSSVYLEDTACHVIQDFPIVIRPSDHSLGPVFGKLKVLVDLLPLLDTSVQRTTKLKVYITDRRGHKSNTVETPEIHLSRPEY